MTESDAKTKTCPIYGVAACFLGDSSRPEDGRCVGSACMMWHRDIREETGKPVEIHGYCGLAGKS